MKIRNEDKNKISDIVDSTITYTKFKFQGIIYSIGDNVSVKDNIKDSNHQIVKIASIIPSKGIDECPFWPCIEVHPYYSKRDIIVSIEESKAISDNELFLSDRSNKIFIETVNRKVTVLTLEDYAKLTEIEEDTYFTRAMYSPLSQEVKPPMSQWENHCYCNTPFNPDLLYICCDKCGKWFHSNCFGLSQTSANLLYNFYCFDCS